MQALLLKTLDILFPPSEDALLVRRVTPEELSGSVRIQSVNGITVLLDYKRALVRALVHEAKFHSSTRATDILGEALRQYFTQVPQRENALLVPVPLSKSRFRERGYNQVTEIIRSADYTANEKTLVRIKHTRPQTELEKEERLKNVAGAFGVRDPDAVQDKHIVLIDDVLTTGATLSAARSALLPHHPASVTCIALAH